MLYVNVYLNATQGGAAMPQPQEAVSINIRAKARQRDLIDQAAERPGRPPPPPDPITADHALADFDCGEPSLNEWLKKRALKNHSGGASRCFVVCNGKTVIGYYYLSAGAISHEAAPKAVRRNMPNPLPVLLLGRLAIDRHHHNQGIGQALVR